jgi:tetratricopeptide (TPR) repeat protein
MTHDYNRAVKYYETRLAEDPKLIDLRTDLAELYLKLKVFDQSKRVLIDALKYLKTQENNLETKSKNVKFLVLMAKVCLDEDMQYPGWKLKENQDAKQAIIEALTLQADVIEICRSTSADRVDEEREFSAEISFRLGCYMEERAGNSEDALLAYNDCLARNTSHIDA